jgi:hypothetical protein
MSYRSPNQRRFPLDQYDLLVWSMDEATVPFISTGTNVTLSLTKGFNPSNITENRSGIFGQTCDFTPAQSLTSGDTFINPPGNSFTISCWVYCRSFPSPSIFVGKTYHLTGTGWNDPFWSISLTPDTSGIFVSSYAIGATENEQDGPSTEAIPLNTWTFLALTYDGHFLKQYINGNLIQTSSDLSASIDWGDGGPWCVGGNNLQQIGGQDGLIDDVRISRVPRSQEYLQRQYKNGLGLFEITDTSGFTPSDIGGLALWLRADKGAILANSKVVTLKDQSGFGGDGTQSNSPDRPLFVPYLGKNGHPYIQFTTNAEWLTGAIASPVAPVMDLTFFLVCRFGDDQQRVPISLTDNGFTASSGVTVSSQNSSPNIVQIERWASGGTQTTQMVGFAADLSIYSATSDASSLQGYVNGTAQGTPAGATTGRYPITNYVLGADNSGGAFEMYGDVYEYILYDRVLDGGELTTVTNYLQKKYGFT